MKALLSVLPPVDHKYQALLFTTEGESVKKYVCMWKRCLEKGESFVWINAMQAWLGNFRCVAKISIDPNFWPSPAKCFFKPRLTSRRSILKAFDKWMVGGILIPFHCLFEQITTELWQRRLLDFMLDGYAAVFIGACVHWLILAVGSCCLSCRQTGCSLLTPCCGKGPTCTARQSSGSGRTTVPSGIPTHPLTAKSSRWSVIVQFWFCYTLL